MATQGLSVHQEDIEVLYEWNVSPQKIIEQQDFYHVCYPFDKCLLDIFICRSTRCRNPQINEIGVYRGEERDTTQIAEKVVGEQVNNFRFLH